MKIKLARKLLSFMLATNFMISGVMASKEVCACNVNTIREQLKVGPIKELFERNYLVVQTAYGSCESFGDSNFFICLLNSIYESDADPQDKELLIRRIVNFRIKEEKLADMQAINRLVSESIICDSARLLSFIDPDNSFRSRIGAESVPSDYAPYGGRVHESRRKGKGRVKSVRRAKRDKKLKGDFSD